MTKQPAPHLTDRMITRCRACAAYKVRRKPCLVCGRTDDAERVTL